MRKLVLDRYAALVEHVQIADVPGRHEPGTGQQPIREFLAELDNGGYTGAVGLEYRPSASTDAALAWLVLSGCCNPPVVVGRLPAAPEAVTPGSTSGAGISLVVAAGGVDQGSVGIP